MAEIDEWVNHHYKDGIGINPDCSKDLETSSLRFQSRGCERSFLRTTAHALVRTFYTNGVQYFRTAGEILSLTNRNKILRHAAD